MALALVAMEQDPTVISGTVLELGLAMASEVGMALAMVSAATVWELAGLRQSQCWLLLVVLALVSEDLVPEAQVLEAQVLEAQFSEDQAVSVVVKTATASEAQDSGMETALEAQDSGMETVLAAMEASAV